LPQAIHVSFVVYIAKKLTVIIYMGERYWTNTKCSNSSLNSMANNVAQ